MRDRGVLSDWGKPMSLSLCWHFPRYFDYRFLKILFFVVILDTFRDCAVAHRTGKQHWDSGGVSGPARPVLSECFSSGISLQSCALPLQICIHILPHYVNILFWWNYSCNYSRNNLLELNIQSNSFALIHSETFTTQKFLLTSSCSGRLEGDHLNIKSLVTDLQRDLGLDFNLRCSTKPKSFAACNTFPLRIALYSAPSVSHHLLLS